MADGERRRYDDGFWGAVLKYWQIIAATGAFAWGCTATYFSFNARITVMETKMIEFMSIFKEAIAENKEYRAEVKSEIKSIREEIREIARAARRQ